MQTITVKIPDDMAEFLEKIAAEEERSKSYYIRKAIAHYMEDLADIRAAKKSLADYEKTGISYSIEDVVKMNGLEE
jgi:predicted DNA-binding protein